MFPVSSLINEAERNVLCSERFLKMADACVKTHTKHDFGTQPQTQEEFSALYKNQVTLIAKALVLD